MPQRILQIHQAYESGSLLTVLGQANEEERLTLLKIASSLGCSLGLSLDQLHELVGQLGDDDLSFALLLFRKRIQAYECVSIGRMLNHAIFNEIRKPLRRSIVKELIDHPKKPRVLDAPAITAFVSGNLTGSFSQHQYLSFFQRIANSASEEEQVLPSAGETLAQWIKEYYETLKTRYEEPLFAIVFDDEQTLLLKQMTMYLLLRAPNDRDTQDFIRHWSEGGLVFFSGLCFAHHEKDTNREFWDEYRAWLGFGERSTQVGGNSHLYGYLRKFYDRYGIPHLRGGENDYYDYVFTFRMHTIVANRPLSRERLPKLLFKAANAEGIMYHDSEEQRILLELMFSEYDKNAVGEDADEENTLYYALPLETMWAYQANPSQVLDFLLPLYNYFETQLLHLYDSVYTEEPELLAGVPPYLIAPIDEFIRNLGSTLVKELGKRQRRGFRRLGVPGLYLDVEQQTLQYIIPDSVYVKQRGSGPISCIIYAEGKIIKRIEDIEYMSSGSFLLYRSIEIPCTALYKDMMYMYSQGGKLLGGGKLHTTPIFDDSGSPVTFPTTIEQSVYCLALDDGVSSDHLYLEEKNIIGDYNLWSAYLSESTPLLLDGIFYGVGKAHQQKAAFIFREIEKNEAMIEIEGKDFPVITSLPDIGLRLAGNTSIRDRLVVLFNSIPITYEIIQDVLLLDGSGDTYYQIQLTTGFPNGELGTLRVLIDDENTLSGHFFMLENLRVAFDAPLYFGDQKIEVNELTFNDKVTLFRGKNYTFPSNLTRFKVTTNNGFAGRLSVIPPRVDVIANDESLYRKNLWYEELKERSIIDVTHPESIRSLALVLLNSEGRIISRLKRSGKRWKANQLLIPPDQGEPTQKLALLMDRQLYEVCTIHYELSIIENIEEWIQYIPKYGESVRVTGTTGLIINPTFHCNPLARYTVCLNDEDEAVIATWEIGKGGQSRYRRDDDLLPGNYTLQVSERVVNSFTKKEQITTRYTESFTYPFVGKTRVIIDQPSSFHRSTILRVQSTMVRQLVVGAMRQTYKKGISIPNFYLEVDDDDLHKESFEALGFYINPSTNERVDMSRFSPFKVTVAERLDNTYVLKVTDNSGAYLQVMRNYGLVNYTGSVITDWEDKHTFFSARVEEREKDEI